MKGRIIKGIGGFYYVYTEDGVYTCKAKGSFRKEKIKPLVGDYVEIDILDRQQMLGNMVDILPRRNEILRPNVANIDRALIIFALRDPEPNFITLDKMILQYRIQNIPVIICLNKEDLVNNDYSDSVLSDYAKSGCSVYITSAKSNEGVDKLMSALDGKTTAVAGPSGAGKSSLVNCLSKDKVMETGDISAKLARGKHTTRHSEIIPLKKDTFIMDTPGFSSFDVLGITADELSDYYSEFEGFEPCRFTPCSHTHEPGCRIKEAVFSGEIAKRRYDNYVYIYEELSKVRRY